MNLRKNEFINNMISEKIQYFTKSWKTRYPESKSVKTCIDAMNYAVESGKRLRPQILIQTYEMISKNTANEIVYEFATAVEMVHAYSLVHDDLPCMDNDDFRRGRPSTHKIYGEAQALLAGNALLTHALEFCLTSAGKSDISISSDQIIKATAELIQGAGIFGMLGGQVFDLNPELLITKKQIENMALMKTGALFKSAVKIGAILANASAEQIDNLIAFSDAFSLAFQAKDDLNDIEKDQLEKKITLISHFNREEAINYVDQMTDTALSYLTKFENSQAMYQFCNMILNANYQ